MIDGIRHAEGGPFAAARARLWAPLLALALTLPATFPLLKPGYFDSDDGWIHLYRLAALDRALHSGVLFPRWFPDFAFGYGYPVLNFYSPLGYYLAEAWHWLGADTVLAMKLTFATGFVLAAWAMYCFAAEVLGPTAGGIAAIAYTYAPYHLADAYTRGALAEHLAFVWFPFLLWTLHRLIWARRRSYIIWAAAGGAGLIITHNLSALIFAPFAAAYGLLLVAMGTRSAREQVPALSATAERPGAKATASTGVGAWPGILAALLLSLALSAFYWLPALAESKFVHLALDFGGKGYQDHLAPLGGILSPFLLYRYFPDQVVAADHPIGLAQALLAVAGVAGMVLTARRLGQRKIHFILHLSFALAVAFAALFLASTASLPVWQAGERVLAVLQYPWRFMSVAAFGTALVSGGVVGLLPQKLAGRWQTTVLLWLAVAGALGYAGLARLPYDSEPLRSDQVTVQRMWDEDYQHQQIGATWTAEYLPRWVRQERWAIPRPAAGAPVAAGASGISAIHLERVLPLGVELTVTASTPQPVSIHQFYFPGWMATVDGEPVEVRPNGVLGLVTATVPAGTHRVLLRFGTTSPRRLGKIASWMAIAVVIGLGIWKRDRWPIRFALAGFLLIGLVIVVHFHPWRSAPPVSPVAGRLGGGQVRLVGYRVDRATAQPAGKLDVTLYWMGLSALPNNYKVFVHLTGENSPAPQSQHDGDPGGGYTPTTRWLPGELVPDTHTLSLSPDLRPGKYSLWAGMYDYKSGKRLPAVGKFSAEDRLLLGTIVVSPGLPR
ncbi:MAG: hypothetical protein GXP41_02775 [Chloroflexi bacterium]|nr:hypothetical protein [Chloroflexota bacterium]